MHILNRNDIENLFRTTHRSHDQILSPFRANRVFDYMFEHRPLLYMLLFVLLATLVAFIIIITCQLQRACRRNKGSKQIPSRYEDLKTKISIENNANLYDQIAIPNNATCEEGLSKDDVSEQFLIYQAKKKKSRQRANSYLRRKYRKKVSAIKYQIKLNRSLGLKDSFVKYKINDEERNHSNESEDNFDSKSIEQEDNPWELRSTFYESNLPKVIIDNFVIDMIPNNAGTVEDIIYNGTICDLIHFTTVDKKIYLAKGIKNNATRDQTMVAEREAAKYIKVDQKNFSRILYITQNDLYQRIFLYEHVVFNNLKLFLRAQKDVNQKSHYSISTHDVINMGLDVITSIESLHNRYNMIHMDIAARNCLLHRSGQRMRVKLTDASMSGCLFPFDYQCLGDNKSRPVKWMSIESLIFHKSNKPSDIWAFGVTLWELLTYSKQPYEEIDSFDMGAFLLEGQRLEKPASCPSPLWKLVKSCWHEEAESRPTAEAVIKLLNKLRKDIKDFI